MSILFKTNSVDVTVPITPCPLYADLSLGLNATYPPTSFHRPHPHPQRSELCPPPPGTRTRNHGNSSFRLIVDPALLLIRAHLPEV